MSFLSTEVMLLVHHQIILSFISGIITEELLIFLAALSAKRILHFWIVFVFGILGIIFIDAVWFWVGRSKLVNKLKKWKIFSKESKIEQKIHKLGGKHKFLSLFLSKFVYGTKIILIVYHSAKEMSFKKFTFYNTLAVLLWAVIMLPIGFFAGKGFVRILNLVHGIEKLFAIILIVIIIFYIVQKIVTKAIIKSN